MRAPGSIPSSAALGFPPSAETIDALRGRSGLFIEIKSPERYEGIERLILSELEAKGLGASGS